MACQLGESGTRTEAIQSRVRRRYGILGTAIVVRTRGGTPVRVGVFVDVCVGAEGARAVKPLERLGPTRLYSCIYTLWSERAHAVRPHPTVHIVTSPELEPTELTLHTDVFLLKCV